ncbi:MAG: PAS domain-containing protein [Pseudomonadota bacterium]|nr:PAS domain-containing protein [Pseudomonadota bacterium]
MPASHNHFDSLFRFLPIGAYRVASDGRQIRANPALVQLNGFDDEAEQLLCTIDLDSQWYVQPGRRTEFLRLLERDGTVVGFESEVYRYKTRERIWVSENAHRVLDEQGRMLYFEGTIEEITDRVLAREALRQSQQHLQEILELVPGMIYRTVVDAANNRHMSFVSPGVRALFGLEPEQLLADGNALHRLRHPADRDRLQAETTSSVQQSEPLQTESRVVLDSGEQKWIQLISAPAPTEDGQKVRVGLIVDITARKHAEEALRENSEIWKSALESTGDGVWDWHLEKDRIELSAQCRALFGYAKKAWTGRPTTFERSAHPDDLPAVERARADHVAGLTPAYVGEYRVRCVDGSWKCIRSRGVVISRDASGKALRMVGTHTDVTDQRQTDALRAERDRAAAADRAKSQFLSRVSHELRTPLNAILGFAQLLEMEPGDGPRQLSWTAQVLEGGRHLLALMDDVLALSSLQSGQLQVDAEPIVVTAALQTVLAMLSGAAGEAGVQVDVSTVADTLAVRADRRRLTQILANLLSNAIKYNRRGGWVRISAQTEGDQVAIAFSDSGPGLSAEQIARLFKPFERLGAARGPVAGTGLGLALSLELAEAMGGHVSAASGEGVGSTFTLWLPTA